MSDHHLLRVRLRDLDGLVVCSDDGTGLNDVPEDEAVDVGTGEVVSLLTHLNGDANDSGPVGAQAVEVYVPLDAGSPHARVGVLEVYVPHAQINREITAGLNTLYRNLVAGTTTATGSWSSWPAGWPAMHSRATRSHGSEATSSA